MIYSPKLGGDIGTDARDEGDGVYHNGPCRTGRDNHYGLFGTVDRRRLLASRPRGEKCVRRVGESHVTVYAAPTGIGHVRAWCPRRLTNAEAVKGAIELFAAAPQTLI